MLYIVAGPLVSLLLVAPAFDGYNFTHSHDFILLFFRMTIVSYVEDVHAHVHRLSEIGSEVVSRNPAQRRVMAGYIVDTLRRQLVATNNLRAACEEHLSNVNQVKDFALQVCFV